MSCYVLSVLKNFGAPTTATTPPLLSAAQLSLSAAVPAAGMGRNMTPNQKADKSSLRRGNHDQGQLNFNNHLIFYLEALVRIVEITH
ncbi:hypothetical protein AKJ16_DCAP08174 [Drosera capensis]